MLLYERTCQCNNMKYMVQSVQVYCSISGQNIQCHLRNITYLRTTEKAQINVFIGTNVKVTEITKRENHQSFIATRFPL